MICTFNETPVGRTIIGIHISENVPHCFSIFNRKPLIISLLNVNAFNAFMQTCFEQYSVAANFYWNIEAGAVYQVSLELGSIKLDNCQSLAEQAKSKQFNFLAFLCLLAAAEAIF